ncbi:hypothetical protein ACN6KF_003064 [Labrys sp. La1]|uniref:hypothetical protein n=1 Tax=Labrys sp. La1 TaxID=3404917 RepID=UPI003EB757BA
MFRTLLLGATLLALMSCTTICFSPSNCGWRSTSGDMSNRDAAALSKMIGGK